jgi:alginate O-acetyltransferase complex protein AlgI
VLHLKGMHRKDSIVVFNSFAFIFWFLPIIMIGFFTIGRYSPKMASLWVILCSFFFYGYWNPKYITLLFASILINYILGCLIGRFKENNNKALAYIFFLSALIIDLSILGYYKYAHFFLSQINTLSGTHFSFENIILPLGISFFTFTQIAFIVDVFQSKTKEYNLLHYVLFVTYFPHLIAGPILHHKEMLPQFLKRNTYFFSGENFSVGVLIFIIGLAKKLFADHFAPYADNIFSATNTNPISFYEGWMGALSYTFQIYFDFSGYCDMAIGLSKMLNILLPINFNSPYKAKNIIEFWRTWHMTLSRFLRDYLYIPLGGNRHGSRKRYQNLLITMVLGGLWHGASWNFILWGTLHGIYLTINHGWNNFLNYLGYKKTTRSIMYTCLGWGVTFFSVVIAWVFFRATDIPTAMNILSGMSGLHGFLITNHFDIFQNTHLTYYLLSAAFICFFLPNTQQIFYRYTPALKNYSDQIKIYTLFNYINFSSVIKIRHFSFLWISYAISILFIVLFYSKNLDANILHIFPTKEGLVYVDMTQGDYRTNLFSNDIFRGKEHKVVIVGSSYTQIMGRFKFSVDGIPYKSASVGNAGNSLANGFRTAVVILNNFKIDTLIFGVSPIGFK